MAIPLRRLDAAWIYLPPRATQILERAAPPVIGLVAAAIALVKGATVLWIAAGAAAVWGLVVWRKHRAWARQPPVISIARDALFVPCGSSLRRYLTIPYRNIGQVLWRTRSSEKLVAIQHSGGEIELRIAWIDGGQEAAEEIVRRLNDLKRR